MTNYVERLSRVERSQSVAAVWCLRLAVFCVPYLLIVILGHRIGAIDTISTFWLLGLAVLLLFGSVAAGILGFYELWTFGHKGGIDSTRGVLLSILLLLPFAFFGIQALLLPQIYDVSTDLDDPPAYDTALGDRTPAMNPITDPGVVQKRLQLAAYPRVAARRYPLDTGLVFKQVVALITDRDWTILASETVQGQAPIDAEGSGLVAESTVDSNGRPLRIPKPVFRPTNTFEPGAAFETVEISPIDRASQPVLEEQEERYIEAVATSFLFGFESDVVFRLIEDEAGTLVDMRSTSRWGAHDLGSNAERIISFLAELDESLQGLSR